MTTEMAAVKKALTSAEWKEYLDVDLLDLDAVLYRSYAVVGLMFVEDAKAAIDRWLTAQSELGELRSKFGRDRDMYLLVCVEEIEASAIDELPAMINDTHTCRKMVVEFRGRSVEEALSDVPILFWSDESAIKEQVETIPAISIPVSGKVLDDLGKRSPGKILDALIDGSYEEDDEN